MNTIIMSKMGGMHCIYGLFIGGSELTNDYTIKSTTPYKLTTKFQNWKQSSSFKRIISSARQNASLVTSKRNLETSPNCSNEYNKDGFITTLEDQVAFYSL